MLTAQACGSLLVTLVQAVVAVVAGYALAKHETRADKAVMVWLVFDVIVHTTLEGPFVWLSLTETIESSNSTLAIPWKEYGKADKRWLISDPTIVSLEVATVTVANLLAVLLILSIFWRKPQRHFLQICLCTCELYGGWMTFAPELLTGSKSLATDNVLYLWVYLVFFNGLWVVIPAVLLYQSWLAFGTAHAVAEAGRGKLPSSGGSAPSTAAAPAAARPTQGQQQQQPAAGGSYNLRRRAL